MTGRQEFRDMARGAPCAPGPEAPSPAPGLSFDATPAALLLHAAAVIVTQPVVDARGRAVAAMARDLMTRLVPALPAGDPLAVAAADWLAAGEGVPQAWALLALRREVHDGHLRALRAALRTGGVDG